MNDTRCSGVPTCPECGWVNRATGRLPRTRRYFRACVGPALLLLLVLITGGVLGREDWTAVRRPTVLERVPVDHPRGDVVWSDFVGPEEDPRAAGRVLDWIAENLPESTGMFEDAVDVEVFFVGQRFPVDPNVSRSTGAAADAVRCGTGRRDLRRRMRGGRDLNVDGRQLIERRRTDPTGAEQAIRTAIVETMQRPLIRTPDPEEFLAIRTVSRSRNHKASTTHLMFAGVAEIAQVGVLERQRRRTTTITRATSPIPEIPFGIHLQREGSRADVAFAAGGSHQAHFVSVHLAAAAIIGGLMTVALMAGFCHARELRRKAYNRGTCAACGHVIALMVAVAVTEPPTGAGDPLRSAA